MYALFLTAISIIVSILCGIMVFIVTGATGWLLLIVCSIIFVICMIALSIVAK